MPDKLVGKKEKKPVIYLKAEVEVIELDEKIRPDYLIMRSN